MAADSFSDAVSVFGASTKSKLSSPTIAGAPEDQLRAPLETLIKALAVGNVANDVHLVGETTLVQLRIRPDYAVSVGQALVGYIEIKAPGKGADPRRFSDEHDKAQWSKLKALPNLLYTDGNTFSLWRDGEPAGKIVLLEGDVETSGAKLAAPPSLLALIVDFLTWEPTPPANAKKLAEVSARLCRLLRDEVVEQMRLGERSLALLADDWRALLFPNATDAQFADGYAQAVTFGLLIARAFDIPLDGGLDLAALRLKRSDSLIGTALSLLTESAETRKALATSLDTLTRVLDVVNWHTISEDKADAWLYFYEIFLEVYDNRLRKQTGSYYTPPEVVEAMVRLVDDALRGPLFERPAGLAARDVTIADPAAGTGTFLLGVLKKIAANVEEDQGKGAVRGALAAAAKRIFGFELQFGPYAVAQLRLLAEMRALTGTTTSDAASSGVNLYITDTLGNPFVEDEHLPQVVEPVARSRREANAVKRGQPITVVIGNPPYKEKAEGRGGWIEQGSDGRSAPLDRWKAPPQWGVGAQTLKVFGAGLHEATNLPARDEEGLICFITVAGFLNGPGFEKMRDDLRRTCSAIWVIDCSPEGHQPDVPTRIFQGVQQPVCIVLAARKHGKGDNIPAPVRFRALPEGRREVKFAALATFSLSGPDWQDCPDDFRAPFLPEATGLWGHFPKLRSLFAYDGSGVMPGRTWIIAPDVATLDARWRRLVAERDPDRKEMLFHPHLRRGKAGDKHSRKSLAEGLRGHEARLMSVANDSRAVIAPVRYGFRTFDRQWIIPDGRLINQPNPTLWKNYSSKQIYITGLEAHSPSSGCAISFCSLVPDLDHYHGRGGRVYPLWADARARQPNVRAEALELLAMSYGAPVSPEDVFAYLAAVMAHPAFTARFAGDLVRPGLRVPLTADADLFQRAAALGREIIWLHCYGERFADAAAGRPRGAPRLPRAQAPTIPTEGAIPPAPEPLPEEMSYDAGERRLRIGKGFIENVTPAMWAYEISGKQVLRQWFSYRRRDRSKPMIGDRRPPSPLEKIQPEGWLAEYTTDLLDLLHVLGRAIALEPAQAALLGEICAGPLIPDAALREAGLIESPAPEEAAAEE